MNGSGAVDAYDGASFSRHGIIFVDFNYRLGAEGFLYTGEGSGNFGLLDQLAALEWVKRNVSAFGGDPNRVTLAGQSAGAMSVATIMSVARARGLFGRVIAMSGAAHSCLSRQTALRVAKGFAEKLGTEATYDALRAVPTDRMLEAQREYCLDVFSHPSPSPWAEATLNGMPFAPVIDGALLSGPPLEILGQPQSSPADILIGSTEDEGRLAFVAMGQVDSIDEVALTVLAQNRGLDEDALALYRSGRPGASPGLLAAAIVGDWQFRIPAIRLAEVSLRQGRQVWVYEFAWKSPAFNGRLGACHALDVQFAFNNLDARWFQFALVGQRPHQVADAMHAAWISFVKFGDPGWEQYRLDTRPNRIFAEQPRTVSDPRAAERKAWDGRR
jgi:para-nitrobenzyl esterase